MNFRRKESKLIMKWMMGCLAFLILAGSMSYAEAAGDSICHQHTSGCYENQPMHCKDDTEVTTHNEEFNCATCGRVASARVVVETYSCKYMYLKRELRRTAYCYTCGNVVQAKENSVNPIHTRMGSVCVCGMEESTVVAKVTLTAANSSWTKGDVVLNATVTEPVPGKSLAPYSYRFSGGTGSGNSCTVSSNGTYSVTVTAGNGQQAVASLNVGNIDKEAPQITECYVDKTYPVYDSANIVIKATDSLSGLADGAYSFDGGVSFSASNTIQIKSNGTYKIVVKDKVGNQSAKTLTVTCFEKKPEDKPSTPPDTGNSSQQNKPSVPVVKNGSLTAGGQGQTSQKTSEIKEKEKIKETSGTIKNTQPSMTSKAELTEAEKKKQALIEQLKRSDKKVPMDKIPGMYSSLLRYNAEKEAVPTTLNIVKKRTENAYSNQGKMPENLVKNITINEENIGQDGNFAQVSKGIVGIGVLLCIGMVGFLIVFLVKKQ